MKFIFVGPSNSGKTTLSQQLAEKYNLVRREIISDFYSIVNENGPVDISENHPMDIEKRWLERGRSVAEMQQKIVETLSWKNKFNILEGNFDILELNSDEYSSQIIAALKQTDPEIILVFCRCSWPAVLERNYLRNPRVPDKLLFKQSLYDEKYFIVLSRKLNISFFSISTEKRTAEESFKGLITVLELAGIEIA